MTARAKTQGSCRQSGHEQLIGCRTTSRTPVAVVTEFLLPLTIEPPTEAWTRAMHADRHGCWITSLHEVFRCTRTASTEVTVERVTTEGGRSVVDEGRLFLRTFPKAIVRTDRRYGVVRIEPAAHPVRMLDDAGQLVPVEDAALAARILARRELPHVARSVDDTRWIAAEELIAEDPDGSRERIDLEIRACGTVQWLRSDPMTNPNNADIITVISLPIPDEP